MRICMKFRKMKMMMIVIKPKANNQQIYRKTHKTEKKKIKKKILFLVFVKLVG